MPIRMRSVDSSHLAQAGHDAASRTLEIQFKDGNVYQYYGVPPSTYQAMLAAESAGQFFNRNIKTKFKSARLTPPKQNKANGS